MDKIIEASNTDTPNGTTTTFTSATPDKWQDNKPSNFRLAQKPDGTLILQGDFKIYRQAVSYFSHVVETEDWRDMETIKL